MEPRLRVSVPQDGEWASGSQARACTAVSRPLVDARSGPTRATLGADGIRFPALRPPFQRGLMAAGCEPGRGRGFRGGPLAAGASVVVRRPCCGSPNPSASHGALKPGVSVSGGRGAAASGKGVRVIRAVAALGSSRPVSGPVFSGLLKSDLRGGVHFLAGSNCRSRTLPVEPSLGREEVSAVWLNFLGEAAV